MQPFLVSISSDVSNPCLRASAERLISDIIEYPWWQPLHDDKVLETQYTDLLTASGCDSLECLRELDSETLTNASQAVLDIGYAAGSYGFGDYYFGPSVDGSIIRDLPSNEFRKGNFVKIPLLVDHDAYEGELAVRLANTQLLHKRFLFHSSFPLCMAL